MCIAALAINAGTDYPLVLAFNREEYYSRGADPAAWWADLPNVLAGRDPTTGGTWCGVSREGRFGFILTPARGPVRNSASAQANRAELVSNWLVSGASAREYLADVAPERRLVRDFRLILGTPDAGAECVVYRGGRRVERTSVATGVSAFDSLADSAGAPKRHFLAATLSAEVQSGRLSEANLFTALSRRTVVADRFGSSIYPALRTPFLAGLGFGTVSSTVITIDKVGRCRFTERTFGPNGEPAGETTMGFEAGGW